jgi:Ca2+-binding EF-hand superfamily protein
MEELKQLIPQADTITCINLEFSEIENLDSILPILRKFSKLQELQLFGNRLENLPADLSFLKNLMTLDISNNLFSSLKSVLPSLRTLPNLRELHISLSNEEEEHELLTALPNLERLNGTDLDKPSDPMQGTLEVEMNESIDYNVDPDHLTLKQEDLEKVAIIYDEIRDMWRSIDSSQDKILAEDFDVQIREVMTELSNAMKQPQSSQVVHSLMIRAKVKLFDICQEKIENFILRQLGKPGQVLQRISRTTSMLFSEMINLFFTVQSKYQDKIQAMQADMEKAMKETAQVLEAAEQLEKRSMNIDTRKGIVNEEYEQKIEELQSEIESLQQENKRYLEMIIKQSKQNASAALNTTSMLPDRESSRNVASSKSITQLIGRSLTLKQLKDVIEEIYASKTKFDQKCSDSKMPRETMEQHMYTFLNHKYGIKNLIIEWAGSIIAGIKKYSSEDNDVAVFGKILRNECDEEFRFVQMQVKETVSELLRMHLKGKYPLKNSNDVAEMLNEKLQGFITEEEWTDIVRYMYNTTDAEILITLIKELIQKKNYIHNSGPKQKLSREEQQLAREREKSNLGKILYNDFLKILLDFQLKGHEKFLSRFVALFRETDADHNGILSEREFRQLVNSMDIDISESDISRLLQIVDPYNNESITFSECVTLFSSEVVPLDENSDKLVAVLQKLSLRD